MVIEHTKENLKSKRKLETNTWEAQKGKKGLRSFTIKKNYPEKTRWQEVTVFTATQRASIAP